MALPVAAGTYAIDTTHSQIGFAVRHLGISTVRGTFDSFRGTLTVGETAAPRIHKGRVDPQKRRCRGDCPHRGQNWRRRALMRVDG